jgi:diguanylate cyclase (GGDEF)-like protein
MRGVSRGRPGFTLVSPTRAGQLAATLYLLGGVYMGATAGALSGVSQDRIWVAALTAIGSGVVVLLIPWSRLPRQALLAPPLWAFLVLLVPIGLYGQALSDFLLLYVLLFTYVGLTQKRGVSLAMLPLALGSLVPAWFEPDRLSSTFLVGPVVVAALLGELMAALTQQHQRMHESVEALLVATGELQAAESAEEALLVIAGLVGELIGADSTTLVMREEDQPDPDCAKALLGGEPVLAPHALYLPLGEGQGVAVAHFDKPRRRINGTAQRAALVLATQSGTVLRRLHETQQLADLATTDALTGLKNRRVFFTALEQIGAGDTVVFLDLDEFKALNDRLGHAAGDEVLRGFGSAVAAVLREGDVAARYGGEEFALLLPATDAVGGSHLAERLRGQWDGAVTFSAGVAEHSGSSPTATLHAADAALFAAKRAGRNRTVVAGTDEIVVPTQPVHESHRRPLSS